MLKPRYLDGKREPLHYDQALQAGWPIATGVIEGACRQPPANMKLGRALNPRATHENTLVMRRSLDDDEDQGDEVPIVMRDPR